MRGVSVGSVSVSDENVGMISPTGGASFSCHVEIVLANKLESDCPKCCPLYASRLARSGLGLGRSWTGILKMGSDLTDYGGEEIFQGPSS